MCFFFDRCWGVALGSSVSFLYSRSSRGNDGWDVNLDADMFFLVMLLLSMAFMLLCFYGFILVGRCNRQLLVATSNQSHRCCYQHFSL